MIHFGTQPALAPASQLVELLSQSTRATRPAEPPSGAAQSQSSFVWDEAQGTSRFAPLHEIAREIDELCLLLLTFDSRNCSSAYFYTNRYVVASTALQDADAGEAAQLRFQHIPEVRTNARVVLLEVLPTIQALFFVAVPVMLQRCPTCQLRPLTPAAKLKHRQHLWRAMLEAPRRLLLQVRSKHQHRVPVLLLPVDSDVFPFWLRALSSSQALHDRPDGSPG